MTQKKEQSILDRLKTYPYLKPIVMASVLIFIINIIASIAFNVLNGDPIAVDIIYQQSMFLIFLESGLGLCLGGIIMFGTFESREDIERKEQIQQQMREANNDEERSKLTIDYLKLREQKNIRVGSFLVILALWIIILFSLLDIFLRLII